jgi:hypothetical protein
MFEVTTFRSGDTLEFEEDFSSLGYSAVDGWTATCTLYGPAVKAMTTAVDGSGFKFTLTAADSAAMAAGTYGFVCRVSKSPEVHTVFDGKITITANPTAVAVSTDLRSKAQIICENIETWMADGTDVTKGNCAQALGALGINIQYMTPRDIKETYAFWKSRWDAETARERVARGQSSGKTYYLRF